MWALAVLAVLAVAETVKACREPKRQAQLTLVVAAGLLVRVMVLVAVVAVLVAFYMALQHSHRRPTQLLPVTVELVVEFRPIMVWPVVLALLLLGTCWHEYCYRKVGRVMAKCGACQDNPLRCDDSSCPPIAE
jgi:hypothetical protein